MTESSLPPEALLQLCEVDRCPVTATMRVIGGKWKPAIIYALELAGTQRFGALRRLIPAATQKMLTQHLRELEADGIVWRRVYAEVPPRVEYGLTARGRTLSPVMAELANWGRERADVAADGGGDPPAPAA